MTNPYNSLERRLIEAAQKLSKDPFAAFDQFTVGYENIFGDLREIGAQDIRFPFHNLVVSEDGYFLNFTLAGWSRDEVKVSAEDNKIVIRGEPVAATEEGEVLYSGITRKAFERTIIVARELEVLEAWMENGMLTIKLVKPEPVSNMREIPIVDGGPTPGQEAVGLGEIPTGHELLNEDLGDRG